MTTGADTHLDGTSVPPRCTAPHALTHMATAIDELLTADLTLPCDTDILDLLRTIETQARRLHTASLAVTSQIGARALAAPAGNAGTIVSTLGGFPADVPPTSATPSSSSSSKQAAVLDPKTFSNLARRIALMANPDGPYNERDAADKQQFHIGRRRDDGLTRCWGLLDDRPSYGRIGR